jgi:hypothetical protein
MKAWGERRCSSYSLSTSALDGGEWSASCPDRALDPRKGPPVPIVQEAGWDPEPVWIQRLDEKSFSPLLGIEQLHLHVQLLAYVYGSTSFLLFQFLISCILSNADVYILCRVLLCIHSLPEWDILILGGQ